MFAAAVFVSHSFNIMIHFPVTKGYGDSSPRGTNKTLQLQHRDGVPTFAENSLHGLANRQSHEACAHERQFQAIPVRACKDLHAPPTNRLFQQQLIKTGLLFSRYTTDPVAGDHIDAIFEVLNAVEVSQGFLQKLFQVERRQPTGDDQRLAIVLEVN
jgi:hypothetical protein